jgi:hypothetical protein
MTSAAGRSARYVPLLALVCLNGLNYVYFLVFAHRLSQPEFRYFAAATAVLMLSLALAEAGTIYAAPPFLRGFVGQKAARISGAFLLIALLLLVAGMLVGAGLWEIFSSDPLSYAWLARCAAIFAPNIAFQTWLLARMEGSLSLIAAAALLRALPLSAIASPTAFDALLAVSCVGAVLLLLWRAHSRVAVAVPKRSDIGICMRLLRKFFLLRVFSTVVTSAAPTAVGLIAGSDAAAAYLIGDRTRALVSSGFQPFVQALYFMYCQRGRPAALRMIVICFTAAVVVSAVLLTFSAGIVNQWLYQGRHPDLIALACFILAGHFSVLSALGYFLRLIPDGHGTAFVRSASLQALLFAGLLVSLTHLAPIRNPALAALSAEGILLVCVAGSIVYYVAASRRATALLVRSM